MNLTKQLSNRFKRSAHCNNYQTTPSKVINRGNAIYEVLSASFQGIKRLFVLTYEIAANAANNGPGIKDNKKYILPRGKTEDFNIDRWKKFLQSTN